MSALFGMWKTSQTPRGFGVDYNAENHWGLALDAIEHALQESQCDARGVWGNEQVGLGMRLLYTTPESRYEQTPFRHPHFPHLVIAADAWLDNRAELCDALSIPHTARATTCDSELILRAYAKWGQGCAAKLLGDFAFALWDADKQQWYCARDFIGARPFFYYHCPTLFCFASDIRAVLACPGVPRQLHEGMLATYLTASPTTSEQHFTYYHNIFKLPPAHFLVAKADSVQLTRFWSPQDAPPVRLASPDAYAEQTRAHLEQAVKNTVRSLYPVGAHLSGGLDSTTVAILAARNAQAQPSLFGYSWSPPPEQTQIAADDERTFIQTICVQENITPRYLDYSPDDAVRIYKTDLTLVPREMVLREERVQGLAAQDKVRVLLSGWGGDELVSYSGRGYLADLFRQGAFQTLHREIGRRIPRGARGPAWLRGYGSVMYRQLFWALMPDKVWEITSPYGGNALRTAFIQPAFLASQRAAIGTLRDPLPRDYAGVRLTQTARLQHGHLTRRMESWAFHGAKRGLVYRYPLLQRPLVDYILGLPPHLYFGEGYSRAVLRGGTRGILPEPMRAARTKAEPTSLGIVHDILYKALHAFYQETEPRLFHHSATQYVNPLAIQNTMRSAALVKAHSQSLLAALSCFYIGAPD